jgi:predicted PurR-regulated permease PerM
LPAGERSDRLRSIAVVPEKEPPPGGEPGDQPPEQSEAPGPANAPSQRREAPEAANAPSQRRQPRARGGMLDPLAVLRVVVIVVAAVVALYVIYLLRKPLGWIVIAGFIAIAVSGPVNALNRRMRRGLAIACVYLGVVLVPVAMLAVIVPPIVTQVGNLARNAPQYAQDLNEFAQRNRRLQELDDKYDLTAKVQEQAADLPSKAGDAAGTLADVGARLVSSLFAALTILILSIFMVGAAPRWRAAILRLQPPGRSDALDRLFDRIGAAVGNYVAGALLQALIAGLSSYLVLLVLGVPYPLALALVIFVLDLVPLIGATIGDHLPAGGEQRHPAAHPGPAGAGRALLRARLGAVREHAVRGDGGPARDPGGGVDADRDPRVRGVQRQPARAQGRARGRAGRGAGESARRLVVAPVQIAGEDE